MSVPSLVRSVLVLLFALLLPCLAAKGAPDAEPDLLAWALSHRPSRDVPEDAIRALIEADAPDTIERLLAVGEPARRALLCMAASDDARAARMRPWLARLQQVENSVEARGLDHAMPYLLACGGEGAVRAARIGPDAIPRQGLPGAALAYWAPRARFYRWAPAADRYVAWGRWSAAQTPLRFRGHDRVVLTGSEGLVRWNSPVTVEAWVRWAHPTSAQYLLTDEAWPELHPEKLPTATKRGFALRRNPRGNGTASLDLTLAVAPDHWISVESAPLAITNDWEHIAVSSDGERIRIFRSGELVAVRSIASEKLLPGLGDLSIGAREYGLSNRMANFDLRGFRISEGARYVEDFVPEQVLVVDEAAIIAPTFKAGGSGLGDGCSPARRHEIVGPRWVPAIDEGAVRRALDPFGKTGAVHVFEADRGGQSAEWYLAERDELSEGLTAEIWTEREPDAAGHWIAVPLEVPKRGTYRLFLAGPGLERLGKQGLVSPFVWSIGLFDRTVVNKAIPTVRGLGGAPEGALSPLGDVLLEAGGELLTIRLLGRRAYDQRYSMWLDAVVLVAID